MKLIPSSAIRFYGYLKKDFQLLVQRKKYLYIFILLPLVIASLFLFALNPGEYEVKVGICDFDGTQMSGGAYSNLGGFTPVIIEYENCLENLNSKIKTGELDLGIEVPEGFAKNIENLEQSRLVIYYDNTDVALSNVISWKVDNSLRPFKRQIIDELNSTIPSVATEMNIDPEIVKPFDYPSFCRAFIKEKKLKIGKSTILLKNDLNILFMKIIEDRILSFAKSISFLPNND